MNKKAISVLFYGVRGSIPSPNDTKSLQRKLKDVLHLAKNHNLDDETSIDEFMKDLPIHLTHNIGANTTCVLVTVGEQKFILDGGSGCFPMGQEWMRTAFGRGAGKATWLVTHTHIDHILGMPMFTPLYIPGNQFDFYSPIPNLEERLINFYDPEFFPVQFQHLASTRNFHDVSEQKEFTIGDVHISWIKNDHPGDSFSYRITQDGRSIVFSTDAEYKYQDNEQFKQACDFFRDADLLIFDAQYAFTESVQKKRDWGHSSSFMGIDFALEANVKKLALFHHEPSHDDYRLVETFRRAQTYLQKLAPKSKLDLIMSHEGLQLDF